MPPNRSPDLVDVGLADGLAGLENDEEEVWLWNLVLVIAVSVGWTPRRVLVVRVWR